MTAPRPLVLLAGGSAVLVTLLVLGILGATSALILGLALVWLTLGWKATATPGALVDASGLGGDPVRRTLWCSRCETGFVATGASDGRCTSCRRIG